MKMCKKYMKINFFYYCRPHIVRKSRGFDKNQKNFKTLEKSVVRDYNIN